MNYISRLQVNRGENDHEMTEVVCFSDNYYIKWFQKLSPLHSMEESKSYSFNVSDCTYASV